MALAGRTFEGTDQFDVVRKLGQGGMGAVYLVHDRERGVNVALKTLLRADPRHLHRLKNEFRALADIVHPNLVRFYELRAQDEYWFITMEYVEGVAFTAHVRASAAKQVHATTFVTGEPARTQTGSHCESPLTTSTAVTKDTVPLNGAHWLDNGSDEPTSALDPLRVAVADYDAIRESVVQLCHGLEAVHAAGKLHCDIKPSNVLVERDHRVVLLDFGLVTDYSATDASTSRESISGTAAYMSPEQTRGATLTPATDWYSVGVLLFEALSGTLPFRGRTADVIRAKRSRNATPVYLVNATVPRDLSELCMQLLARDPTQRPCGAEIRAQLEPKARRATSSTTHLATDVPLVGREPELTVLRNARMVVSNGGTPQWVFVHGRSGMGKTALVKAFLDEIRGISEVVTFAGQCHQRESVPFKAIDGLVDNIVAHLAKQPKLKRETLLRDIGPHLVRAFPVFAQLSETRLPPSETQTNNNAEELRRDAFTGLIELLRRLSQHQCLVLSVDDLQWGDLDSVAFFLKLTKTANVFPFLFIGTYRTDEAQRLVLQPLLQAQLDNVTRSDIAVEPLAHAESSELARRLLPAALRDNDNIVRTIASESAGCPYFVAELAQTDRSERPQVDRQDSWSLDEALYARICQLSPPAQRLLEMIAVAGGPISQAPVFSAANLSPHQVDDVLPTLRSQRLIKTSGMRNLDTIETFHDRIRETIVARLEPRLLVAIHKSLATSLERLDSTSPELLVAHYQGAREHDKAAQYAIRAADHAMTTLAFEQAARLYKLAITLVDPNDPHTQRLRIAYAEALDGAGRASDAGSAYLLAADTAPTRHEAFDLKRRASELFLASGRVVEGLDIGKTILAEVGTRLPRSGVGAIASMLWQRLLLRLRGPKLSNRGPVDDEQVLIAKTFTSVAMGLSMFEMGAAAIQVRALRMSLRLGDPESAAINLALEGGFQACGGASTEPRVKQIFARANQLLEGNTNAETLGTVKMCEAIAEHLFGHFRRSVEECEQARTILRRCRPSVWAMNQVTVFPHTNYCFLGEYRKAAHIYDQAVPLAKERNDRYLSTSLTLGYRTIAKLALTGNVAETRAEATEVAAAWQTRRFDAMRFYEVMTRANLYLYEGNGDKAWQYIVSKWSTIRRSMFLWVEVSKIEMVDVRMRCALAAAHQRSERKALLRCAVRDAQSIAKRHAGAPYASLVRAQLAWLEGNTDGAHRSLKDAVQQAEALDLKMHAAVARQRLGELHQGGLGQQYVDAARAVFTEETIADPDRFVAMLSPGFEAMPSSS